MNKEINKENWTEFLNKFNKRNENRPAKVEVLSEELGAQEVGQHLPLVGVSYETKGSEAGDVVITFAGKTTSDNRNLSHRINSVTKIIPGLENPEGEDNALEFESADGIKTILVFERLPELPPAD